MSWLHSVRWRLTLWYAAALTLGLCLFAAASFVVISRVLNTRADRFLRDARGGFLVELAVEATEFPEDEKAVRMAVQEVRFEETRFLVYDGIGRLIAATAELAPGAAVKTASTAGNLQWNRKQLAPLDTLSLRSVLTDYDAADRRVDELMTIPAGPTEYRVVVGGASVHGRPFTVLAVQDRSEHHETMRRVAVAYAFGIPLYLLAALGGGYFLAKRALEPVGAMARQARAISAATLHERLPVGNARDELGELSQVVNELLSRLEKAFAQQIRFVADASHELRTPVAILQAESEVALAREHRSEDEYRDALDVVSKSSQRLSRIVQDLFLLARADAGHMALHPEPLYLDELLADSVRVMRTVASSADVNIEFISDIDELGAMLNGSPSLLDRLVLNLLDNAIKHSPRGGVVRVALSRRGGSYLVTVTDSGPGIPIAAQPHIFDRFYRVDPARAQVNSPSHRHESNGNMAHGLSAANGNRAHQTPATSGAGLGLAIAQWIAEAHGGSIELRRSESAGSEFLVVLPTPESQLNASVRA